MTTLTAIVPATDRPATLARCLAAIRCADEPPEQIVVIDGPAGASPALARNEGAARATGEVLVFIDADVLVEPGVFRRIRTHFAGDAQFAAVFGAYDDDPAAPGVVSWFRNLLHHHIHSQAPGQATTFWSGLGAVRSTVFAGVGGFDGGRYPRAAIEDVEFGGRLVASGARILLDPSIRGKHLKAWTLRSMVTTDFRDRGLPWVALLLEQRASTRALNLGWRHRLSAATTLAGAGAVALGRPRLAAGTLVALVALNRSFYSLLLRRRGPLAAAAGIALHAVHHLTGAAAAAVALGLHVGGHRPTGTGESRVEIRPSSGVDGAWR